MPRSLVIKREQNGGLDSFKWCWAIFASVQTDSNGESAGQNLTHASPYFPWISCHPVDSHLSLLAKPVIRDTAGKTRSIYVVPSQHIAQSGIIKAAKTEPWSWSMFCMGLCLQSSWWIAMKVTNVASSIPTIVSQLAQPSLLTYKSSAI